MIQAIARKAPDQHNCPMMCATFAKVRMTDKETPLSSCSFMARHAYAPFDSID